MSNFCDDRLRWLEKATTARGGATILEMSKAFGISMKSTIAWVCYWENYDNKPRDIVQHFITRIPGSPAKYVTGPDDWGERYNSNSGEGFHDQLDVSGLDPMKVVLGQVRTRTDSITGKRTLAGMRKRNAYFAYINGSSAGVTAAQFASQFNMTRKSASTMLSRWKSDGMLKKENGLWLLSEQQRKEVEVVLAVENDYDEDGYRHTKDVWRTVEKSDDQENAINVHNEY